MDSFKSKLSNLSEMVMFKHSIFSLPFIFIAMLVASKLKFGTGWFGWELLILGIFAAITARNFAMGVNRYFDRDIDALNPRTKNRPSVDGRVSAQTMLVFMIGNAIAFVVIAYFINPLAFQLSVPILAILGAYTFLNVSHQWLILF